MAAAIALQQGVCFGIGIFSVTKLKRQLLQGGLRFRYETPRLQVAVAVAVAVGIFEA